MMAKYDSVRVQCGDELLEPDIELHSLGEDEEPRMKLKDPRARRGAAEARNSGKRK